MVNANETTKKIIGCAIAVHSHLGPGLLESAYQACLFNKLNRSGLTVEKEIPLPIYFEGIKLNCGYRIDLLVENSVIVEVKSVEKLIPIHTAHLLTYLKLSGNRIGLLLNFNECRLIDGVKRIMNGY